MEMTEGPLKHVLANSTDGKRVRQFLNYFVAHTYHIVCMLPVARVSCQLLTGTYYRPGVNSHEQIKIQSRAVSLRKTCALCTGILKEKHSSLCLGALLVLRLRFMYITSFHL